MREFELAKFAYEELHPFKAFLIFGQNLKQTLILVIWACLEVRFKWFLLKIMLVSRLMKIMIF